MSFFTYDHHGDGFETHETAEEAKQYAQDRLDSYLQSDDDDLIDICWGEIKESVYANDEVFELKKD